MTFLQLVTIIICCRDASSACIVEPLIEFEQKAQVAEYIKDSFLNEVELVEDAARVSRKLYQASLHSINHDSIASLCDLLTKTEEAGVQLIKLINDWDTTPTDPKKRRAATKPLKDLLRKAEETLKAIENDAHAEPEKSLVGTLARCNLGSPEVLRGTTSATLQCSTRAATPFHQHTSTAPRDLNDLQKSILEQFPSGSFALKAPKFLIPSSVKTMSGTGKIFVTPEDVEYAKAHNRIIHDKSLRDLVALAAETKGAGSGHDHFYSYIFTNDGHVSYGEVRDGWEYGVKHIHIAGDRSVAAAGELKLNEDGTVEYNLRSGSYTQRILDEPKSHLTEKDLQRKVQKIFSEQIGADRIKFNDKPETLFPNTVPDPKEIANICRTQVFQKANRSLLSSTCQE